MLQTLQIELPRLLHPPFIDRIAESGAETEPGKIEPAGLMSRAQLAAARLLEERVRQTPEQRERPEITSRPDQLLQPLANSFQTAGVASREGVLDRSLRILDGGLLDRLGEIARTRRFRFLARVEAKLPSVVRLLGFTPELQGSELGQSDREPHRQAFCFPFLSEPKHGPDGREHARLLRSQFHDLPHLVAQSCAGGEYVERDRLIGERDEARLLQPRVKSLFDAARD